MIDPFAFELTTRIVWGAVGESLPAQVAALGASRVLLVGDPGLAGVGMVDSVRAILEKSGSDVAVYAEVAGNPTTEDVTGVRTAATDAAGDVIVALGGGSVIDTAKAAALLLANGGAYADYQWGGAPIARRSHPLIAVPTTAGTGSEVTRVAVISDVERPFKKGVLSPLMFPHAAVLDPELTVGLPPRLTAATGMDAFSHALEAYVGRRAEPLSDLLALESLRLAVAALPRAVADGEDRSARSRMMLAALFGGIAMDQAGLGLVHAISGGVCTHLHLHHGTANALILPHVLAFNAPAIPEERWERLTAVFGLPPAAPASDLVDVVTDFVRGLGLPLRLADFDRDLDAVDWDAVAEESSQMAMIGNNPRPAGAAECRSLVEAMR